MNPDAAIERLYDLHPGTTPVEEGSPHERPHKPLLLLAALDLIDEGLATPERIPWSRELRDRFSARFLLGDFPDTVREIGTFARGNSPDTVCRIRCFLGFG